MPTDRWRRIEEIFEEVLVLPEGERDERLAELCGGDEALRMEVISLLAADAGASDFLERPVAPPDLPLPPPSAIGRRLGPWRVESKLGEGGMATVYLGVRDDGEFRQKVAIKIFGYGADRSDLLERFRGERQILASLDHPNIARLLDGGTTEDGLPYLVMEHIDGTPIDHYCTERVLGIDARIDLFRQVCAAVQYAHQNLVVHRDIKPSNILVTPDGRPHLLDFGIAKLLEGSALPSMLTLTGQRLMTPQYASPEQVEGKPVTTATDVYSLGVLLYVLLTGRLPYRVDPDRMGAFEQAVLAQEPERPSTAAGRSSPGNGGAAPAATAERDRRLVRRLAGDLDNIVLMALRKEPQRRYASVELLSEDLRLCREGMPVRARPATLGYRTAKFVGRHPMGVGLAAGTFLLVLALAVVMTIQAARLARQRDEIRQERDKAVAVARLLEDVFSVSDPSQARGETVTARELLDQGAARVQAELGDQPEVQASLATTIGQAYRGLGLNDRSLPLLEKSLALRRRIHGEEHPEVAESLEALGTLAQARGEIDRAEALHRQALAMRQKLLGPDDPAVAGSLNSLAADLLLKAKYDAAEPLFREALAINRRHFGNDHEEVATSLGNLGLLEKQRGHPKEAEALYREALGIMRRVFGPAHPMIATQLNNLAALQADRGDLAGAEASYREALAVAHRIYGEEHPEIALELNNLAAVHLLRGDTAAAEEMFRRSLAMRRKLLGPEHEQVAMALNNLAQVLRDEGKLAAARPLYEEALRIQRKTFGEEHPRVGTTLANLAALSAAEGDLATAETLAQQALAIRRKTLGDAHPDVGASLVSLGSVRLARGNPAAAEPLLRQGVEILRAALPAGHWRLADAESQLGACLAARGRPTEAGPLLASGYEALARVRGPSHPKTVAACERLSAFRKEHGGGPALSCHASQPPA